MAFLFVLWIVARSLLYAALQANVIWAVAMAVATDRLTNWIQIWQFLAALHTIINSRQILRANRFKVLLTTDTGLFIIGLGQGVFIGSLLTLLIGAIIWLTSRWTGFFPDWPLLWIGIPSLATLFFRWQAKRKGRQAWEGAPAKNAIKQFSFGHQSPNLPQWQQTELAQHRRIRASEGKEPDQIVWTSSKEGTVTEIGPYWASVQPGAKSEHIFTVYSKTSGSVSKSGFDYQTESEAMIAAVEFMRDGKDPAPHH
jgi:hypothetical protein